VVTSCHLNSVRIICFNRKGNKTSCLDFTSLSCNIGFSILASCSSTKVEIKQSTHVGIKAVMSAGRFFSSATPTREGVDFLNTFIEKMRNDPSCFSES
jgi:hypothetical protein